MLSLIVFYFIPPTESNVFMQSTAATLSVEATPYLTPTVLLKDTENNLRFHALTIATPIAIVAILCLLFFVIVVLFAMILCMWSLLERRYQLKQVMEKAQPVSALPTKMCVV